MPRLCYLKCDAKDTPLHSFPNPTKSRERFWLWISAANVQTNDKGITKEFARITKLCDVHFELKYKARGKRLNQVAVPTLFLDGYQEGKHRNSKDYINNARPLFKLSNVNVLPGHDELHDVSGGGVDAQDLQEQELANNVTNETESTHRKEIPDTSDIKGVYKSLEMTQTKSGKLFYPSSSNLRLNRCRFMAHIKNLQEAIRKVFPSTDGNGFTATWQDTNSEFVFAEISQLRKAQEGVHSNVTCNNCGCPVVGFCYKCIWCPDWDQCAKCEARGFHSDHFMLRIPRPLYFKEADKLVKSWREVFEKNNVSMDGPYEGRDNIMSDAEMDPDSDIGVTGTSEFTSSGSCHSVLETTIDIPPIDKNSINQSVEGNDSMETLYYSDNDCDPMAEALDQPVHDDLANEESLFLDSPKEDRGLINHYNYTKSNETMDNWPKLMLSMPVGDPTVNTSENSLTMIAQELKYSMPGMWSSIHTQKPAIEKTMIRKSRGFNYGSKFVGKRRKRLMLLRRGVNDSQTKMQKTCERDIEAQVQAGLDQLLSLDYIDDDGFLSSMLRGANGDVQAVLQQLNPDHDSDLASVCTSPRKYPDRGS